MSEWARRRGVSVNRVRQLVLMGRVEGARRVGGRWLIPADAKVTGSSRPFENLKDDN